MRLILFLFHFCYSTHILNYGIVVAILPKVAVIESNSDKHFSLKLQHRSSSSVPLGTLGLTFEGLTAMKEILNPLTPQQWTFQLNDDVTNRERVRLTQSRSWITDKVVEFRLHWNIFDNLNQMKRVCFSWKDPISGNGQWFATSLLNDALKNHWPMSETENFHLELSLIPETHTQSIGTLVEHLFLNSQGFAIHLEPTHFWTLENPKDQKSHWCVRTTRHQKSVNKADASIDHPERYRWLEFRILVGADLRTVWQEAVDSFGYIPRLVIVPTITAELLQRPVIPFGRFRKHDLQNSVAPSEIITLDALSKSLKSQELAGQCTIILDDPTGWSVSGADGHLRYGAHHEDLAKSIYACRREGHLVAVSVSPTRSELRLQSADDLVAALRQLFTHQLTPKLGNSVDLLYLTSLDLDRTAWNLAGNQMFGDTINSITTKYENLAITAANQMAAVQQQSGGFKPIFVEQSHRSQPLPVVVRLPPVDTDHCRNPIRTLVQSALTASMAGYPLVYGDTVDGHQPMATGLYRDWLLVATFLPVFGLPWPPSEMATTGDMTRLLRNCLRLRTALLVPVFQNLTRAWAAKGGGGGGDGSKNSGPLLRPMWWWNSESSPNPARFEHQFMIGDVVVVVVRVVTELDYGNQKRKPVEVYLPPGRWRRGRDLQSEIEDPQLYTGDVIRGEAEFKDFGEVTYFYRVELSAWKW